MMARKLASGNSANSAPQLLQWSRANDGAETPMRILPVCSCRSSFNGAAPMMARKHDVLAAEPLLFLRASMEPRQ